MTRMTPELPDPALHSDGLSPGSLKNGNGRSGSYCVPGDRSKKSGLAA